MARKILTMADSGFLKVLLIVSAVSMTAYIAVTAFRPFPVSHESPADIENREQQLRRIEQLPEIPALRDDIFRSDSAAGDSEQQQAEPVFLRETDEFVLMGVSLGSKRLAFIRDSENRYFYRAQGQKLGEYTVKEVERRRVVLEKGPITIEVTP